VALALALVLACAKGEPVEPQLSTTLQGDDGVDTAVDTMAGPGDSSSAADSSGDPPGTSTGGEAEASTGMPSESTGGEGPPAWLLTVDESGPAPRLVRIDVGSAQTSEVCTFVPGVAFDSLAITRGGEIYGHDPVADMIRRVDPCTCGVTDLMSSQGPMQLTADASDGLYGLRTVSGELVAIDVASATFSPAGQLGPGFVDAALAWSDEIDAMYAVSADTDRLYFVDPGGTVSLITDLAMDVSGIGLDINHGTELLYMCSASLVLQWVDTTTGGVVVIAAMNGLGSCNDLAAPWSPVACVPD
jgi:hypothetical protein